MLRRLVLAFALVGALFMATAAQASARDRNNDRIPDRWEKRHGLSLEVKQTRRDQDRDGLRNRAEFRAHMDPRDDDSDDDGTEDGDENAGTVVSFENGTLTIDVFGGGEVSGQVTADTEIECEGDDDDQGEDESGDDDDRSVMHEDGDDDNSGPGSDDSGEDENEDENDDSCAAGALSAGAVVHEAELRVSDGGAVWEEIELA
jgi:hypothetical protein